MAATLQFGYQVVVLKDGDRVLSDTLVPDTQYAATADSPQKRRIAVGPGERVIVWEYTTNPSFVFMLLRATGFLHIDINVDAIDATDTDTPDGVAGVEKWIKLGMSNVAPFILSSQSVLVHATDANYVNAGDEDPTAAGFVAGKVWKVAVFNPSATDTVALLLDLCD